MNLLNGQDVRKYIVDHNIDIVIHAANPNPVKNQMDKPETMFEESIRIFMNLFHAQDCYEMMYTLGSGAEYDKSKDLHLVDETDVGRTIPGDSYGFAKYVMNKIIESNDKQCNLRIFACYGPTDHPSKFITHAINCCQRGDDITIRQNCYFDYMHVNDLARILELFIYNKPKYRAYNVCTANRVTLEEIAKKVRRQMGVNNQIVILSEGWNKEYTGSNKRLLEEIGPFEFMSLDEGIAIQIECEKK